MGGSIKGFVAGPKSQGRHPSMLASDLGHRTRTHAGADFRSCAERSPHPSLSSARLSKRAQRPDSRIAGPRLTSLTSLLPCLASSSPPLHLRLRLVFTSSSPRFAAHPSIVWGCRAVELWGFGAVGMWRCSGVAVCRCSTALAPSLASTAAPLHLAVSSGHQCVAETVADTAEGPRRAPGRPRSGRVVSGPLPPLARGGRRPRPRRLAASFFRSPWVPRPAAPPGSK